LLASVIVAKRARGGPASRSAPTIAGNLDDRLLPTPEQGESGADRFTEGIVSPGLDPATAGRFERHGGGPVAAVGDGTAIGIWAQHRADRAGDRPGGVGPLELVGRNEGPHLRDHDYGMEPSTRRRPNGLPATSRDGG
jgi:hypothetical protein